MLDLVSDRSANKRTFCFTFLYLIGYQSAQFFRRALQRRLKIPSPECSNPGGVYIYIYIYVCVCVSVCLSMCLGRLVGCILWHINPGWSFNAKTSFWLSGFERCICREEKNFVFWFGAQFNLTLNFIQSR